MIGDALKWRLVFENRHWLRPRRGKDRGPCFGLELEYRDACVR